MCGFINGGVGIGDGFGCVGWQGCCESGGVVDGLDGGVAEGVVWWDLVGSGGGGGEGGGLGDGDAGEGLCR